MQPIKSEVEAYIRAMILSGDDNAKENNLEKLCSLLNKKHVPNDVEALCQAIVGLFFDKSERLRRWSFNAFALLGKYGGQRHLPAIEQAILRNIENPSLLPCAVSAFFAICRDEQHIFKWLNDNSIPLQGALLVAVSPFNKSCAEALSKQKINIDIADPLSLQNVAVLVGLEKVPDNVFSERHPYKGIIGRLNLHDDKLVRQYSIWAISENPHLELSDLGINIEDIDSQPDNVKKWLFHLVARDSKAEKHRGIIEHGISNDNTQIRENLAAGLSQNYFSGCEEFIIPWVVSEKDAAVRMAVFDHMATNVNNCESYFDFVVKEFERQGVGSSDRKRLLMSSGGTKLFGKLRQIEYQQEESLLNFSQPLIGVPMTTTTININNSNIGTLNSGSTFIKSSLQAIQNTANPELQKLLEDVVSLIGDAKLEKEQQAQLNNKISEAATKPSKVSLNGLADCLRTVGSVNGVVELSAKIAILAAAFI